MSSVGFGNGDNIHSITQITSCDGQQRYIRQILAALNADPFENRRSKYRVINSPHPWDCMFHVLASWRAGQIVVLAGGAEQGIEIIGNKDHVIARDVDMPSRDTDEWLEYNQLVFPNPPDAPAAVIMSSGTTGTRRGIVLTRAAIEVSCDILVDVFKMTRQESYGNLSPIHSMGGLRAFMFALRYGNDIRFFGDSPISGLAYAEQVLSSGVAVCLSGASFVRLLAASGRWLAQSHTPLRAIMSCGSLYDDKASAAVQKAYGINVVNSYGQTETTGLVMSENLGNYRPNRMPPSLTHAKQHFRSAGADDVEELGIETPFGFAGYLSHPPHCGKIIWTGDLVRRHADGIEFVGRADHSIKSATGESWLFPDHVETWIRTNTDIQDAAARPLENHAGLLCVIHAQSVPADLHDRICKELGSQYRILVLRAGQIKRTPAGKLLKMQPHADSV
jgi:acyl-coenzyme A synthetase/AMP-(fatty) acid ligase